MTKAIRNDRTAANAETPPRPGTANRAEGQPNEFIVHFAPSGSGSPTRNSPAVEAKKSLLKRIAEKVWTTIKWVFKIAVGVGLFIFNSSFFAVGFIVGLVFNKQINPAIDKITLVWKRQSLAVGILVGIGAFLALPVTLAASATLYGAVIGSKLSNDAQKKEKRAAAA